MYTQYVDAHSRHTPADAHMSQNSYTPLGFNALAMAATTADICGADMLFWKSLVRRRFTLSVPGSSHGVAPVDASALENLAWWDSTSCTYRVCKSAGERVSESVSQSVSQ